MQSAAHTDTTPWYRQPFVWLVIAFPALAVIGGLTILVVSLNIDHGVVEDDYYKRGKEINRVLARDHRAAELGLHAVSQYNPDNHKMLLVLQSAQQDTVWGEVRIKIMHATLSSLDIFISHHFVGGTQVIDLPRSLEKGPWIVQLETEEWRLNGRFKVPGESRIELVPAI